MNSWGCYDVAKLLWNMLTPPNSEIICGRNVSTKVVCGIILFFEKKAMLKIRKKSWVPVTKGNVKSYYPLQYDLDGQKR